MPDFLTPPDGARIAESVIETRTHGRYLVAQPEGSGPVPLLVGFHGYAEGAADQMARMQAIPGSRNWLVVSIQGLHRFYQRRTDSVVASWMTSQDRGLAIADNIEYVAAALQAVAKVRPCLPRAVFSGFSQGVAMAFRAAVAAPRRTASVIAVGGDVPPELGAEALRRLSRVLVCRGQKDEWYTAEKFNADVERLKANGVDVRPLVFEGGHEWTPDVTAAAGSFLREGE